MEVLDNGDKNDEIRESEKRTHGASQDSMRAFMKLCEIKDPWSGQLRYGVSGYVDEKFIFFSRNLDIFTDKQNIYIFLAIVCGEIWDRL